LFFHRSHFRPAFPSSAAKTSSLMIWKPILVLSPHEFNSPSLLHLCPLLFPLLGQEVISTSTPFILLSLSSSRTSSPAHHPPTSSLTITPYLLSPPTPLSLSRFLFIPVPSSSICHSPPLFYFLSIAPLRTLLSSYPPYPSLTHQPLLPPPLSSPFSFLPPPPRSLSPIPDSSTRTTFPLPLLSILPPTHPPPTPRPLHSLPISLPCPSHAHSFPTLSTLSLPPSRHIPTSSPLQPFYLPPHIDSSDYSLLLPRPSHSSPPLYPFICIPIPYWLLPTC